MDKFMDYSNKGKELTRKVYYSRMRILSNHPFFGMLILDVKFRLDSEEKTFSTDGTTISFNPIFLEKLNEEELDICLLHSIMHIVLKHPFRESNYANKELYNLACDIVVNSNILYSIGGLSSKKELIVQGQILPHKTPNGEEGFKYSTQEVYNMLMKGKVEKPKFDELPLVEFISNKSGKIYLKEMSVQTYYKNGDWKNFPRLDQRYLTHPFNFTFDKIENLKLKTSNIKITNLFEREVMSFPCYSNEFNSLKSDVYLEYKGNINKSHNFKYFYKTLSLDLLEELKNTQYKNIKLIEEEKKYREFVYNNYLGITKELQDFFSGIINFNNFSKDDKDIILKVCTYIKRSARYDLEYIETPKDKDFIIHFLSETKIGLCRHFAASATMLYRALGIPARYTVGFLGKTKKDKVCFVSDKDLHAWVDVYVDGVGWILVDPTASSSSSSNEDEENDDGDSSSSDNMMFDEHKMWSESNGKNSKREQEINKRIMDAKELHEKHQKINGHGNTPSNIPSIINKLTKPQIDWRVYLQNFIQENIIDYSFTPPDNRFSDSDFIMPSFSEPDEEIKDILFMVDVSGSMSLQDIITCFSEIQSAINIFNGKLKGHVGFFDAKVHGVEEIDEDTDVRNIKPIGRGGTNFDVVFKYIEDDMRDRLPASIIILTDGYCDFPKEEVSLGIPVLWVINNNEITPPWGNITRIGVGEDE